MWSTVSLKVAFIFITFIEMPNTKDIFKSLFRTIKNIRITLYALVIDFSEEAYFMAWDSPVWQHKILDKYNFMKKDIFIDIDVYSRPEGDIQGVDFDETN